MRSGFIVTAGLVGAVIVAACTSRGTAPPAPTATINPGEPTPIPTPIPTSTGDAEAVLTIPDFSVREVANPGYFGYLETFTLVETSGLSGATVTEIVSHSDSSPDTEATGDYCWRNKIRVEPKGTSDTFKRPDALVYYCAPYAAGRTKAHHVWMALTFVDDGGRIGTIAASADVK